MSEMEGTSETVDVQETPSASSSSTFTLSDILTQLLEVEDDEPGECRYFWQKDDQMIEVFREEEIQNEPGKRMLWAAENNKLELIKEMLFADPRLVHSRDCYGYTPLHRAANNDHAAVAELLLLYSADVNARTNDGWQPLHCACSCKSARVTTLLLHSGADVNSKNDEGLTPLHMACS